MKKFFYSLAVFAALLSFAACDNEMDESGAQTPESIKQSIENNIGTRAGGAFMAKSMPVVGPEVTEISYAWTNPLEVLDIFPESVTPKGIFDDFLFISNGEPFTLVMLYSNGAYRHELGIYWYDEDGDCHEKNLWNEFDEMAKKPATWKNANGQKTDQISRISDKAGAYTIQLPKGTKFGFYSISMNNDALRSVVKENCNAYKFYTEAAKNWNYKKLKGSELACQSMCTNVNDWTVIGIEDISLTNSSCDKDFNDCVFAINPQQIIDGAPNTEKVEGSVETNLSVADKGSYDQVKLSMHVRANTDVKVVLPIADEVLADDFNIVAKHDIEASYSEPIQIADKTIELVYTLTEKGYLQIETKGITQEILDYCNNHYADGLTFECNLAYGKFVLADQPTITFTNEPTYYVTSCVNNSSEANDIEIVWPDVKNLIFTNPKFGPEDGLNYTHKFYSNSTLEELQEQGWLKKLTE